MVYFVLTRAGFDELISFMGRVPSPIWVNKDVLTHEELVRFRNEGVDLTNFSSQMGALDFDAIRTAINTIQEHHPGQKIWVEFDWQP